MNVEDRTLGKRRIRIDYLPESDSDFSLRLFEEGQLVRTVHSDHHHNIHRLQQIAQDFLHGRLSPDELYRTTH